MLLILKDACLPADNASPDSLEIEVRLKVKSGSAALAGQGPDILAGGLQGLWLTAQKFPVTTGLSVALDGIAVTSPEGVIASSGIQKTPDEPDASLTTGMLGLICMHKQPELSNNNVTSSKMY